MRGFFKALFASCLGTILAFALLFILLLGIFSVAGIQKDKAEPKSVLLLDFKDVIPEKTGNVRDEFSFMSSGDFIGLNDMIKAIQYAAEDPNIEGISIVAPVFMGGQATLQAVRRELENFKESGKFIYSYSDFYTQGTYWLSTVSDSLFLNPNGLIDLKGMGVSLIYFKNLLEKTGIDMEVFYAGKFKSATEPFRRDHSSPENKLQLKEFLYDLEEVMIRDISIGRGLDEATVKSLIRGYQGGVAFGAVNSRLADDVLHLEEYHNKIRSKIGISSGRKINFVRLPEYRQFVKSKFNPKVKDKIAVIYAEGEIVMFENKKGSISDVRYRKVFERLLKDSQVKGVVLRVNSPGGNALVSDNLHAMIEELKAKGIPVVASFGDYAASGGYYLSAGADLIVAEENTLTGSIGVFVMLPYLGKMMRDKLGITYDSVKTAPLAVSFNPMFSLSNQEITHMQASTQQVYNRLLEKVSIGRSMTLEEVEEVAQGRIWSGKKAMELGLVDAIGGLSKAIELAADKAGIEEYKIVEYPFIKENPLKMIVESLLSEDDVATIQSKTGKGLFLQLLELDQVLKQEKPQARLPFIIQWN